MGKQVSDNSEHYTHKAKYGNDFDAKPDIHQYNGASFLEPPWTCGFVMASVPGEA